MLSPALDGVPGAAKLWRVGEVEIAYRIDGQ